MSHQLKMTVIKGGFYLYKTDCLKPLPIPDFNKNENKCSSIIELVKEILISYKNSKNVKTDNDKKIHQKKIDLLEKQNDQMVYDLFGLTEEDIKIIENNV